MLNTAKNEITGRYIKSLPPTQAFRDGWDNIFAKKTGEEWHAELYPDIRIKSYDGFRDINFHNEKISESDFNTRFNQCTLLGFLADDYV